MDQEKYQHMQMMDYQMKQLQKVIESIDTQLSEINNTIEALKEFEKLKTNDEILFPIANGVFAKGKLTDNKILKLNIGSNVSVDKSIKDTIDMMIQQLKEIETYKIDVVEQLDKLVEKMQELQG